MVNSVLGKFRDPVTIPGSDILLSDLFYCAHVDNLRVNAAGVEEPDDLAHGLRADQLAAGQHSLHGGHHLDKGQICCQLSHFEG